MTGSELLARLHVRTCRRCGRVDGRSAWGAMAAAVAEWRCPACGSDDARVVAAGALAFGTLPDRPLTPCQR